ncbi:MAG: hypothetical protein D6717_05380 [Gammaproteobacteria bacterium]|nr:MAG: hypothetical protein D6717_05380 [Gammaproteobacteria bacterium]
MVFFLAATFLRVDFLVAVLGGRPRRAGAFLAAVRLVVAFLRVAVFFAVERVAFFLVVVFFLVAAFLA